MIVKRTRFVVEVVIGARTFLAQVSLRNSRRALILVYKVSYK